jgi:phosphatidylglycerol:prolipoprotein diacylglycerol transferase
MYPDLLPIGSSFIVKSLYFFSALGLIVSMLFFSRQALKNRLRLQFVVDIFYKLLLSGIIWGRLIYVLINYQFYFFEFSFASVFKSLAFWADKSLSFWGFLFGVILSFISNANKRQEDPKKWGDTFALSFLLFMIFANFAAFLDGSNFGKPTDAFVGVTFLNNINVKYLTPIHPTQLYAMFYCVLIFMFLYAVQRKYRNQIDGLIFYLAGMLFSFCKFIEGFFRGDDVSLMLFNTFRLTEIIFLMLGFYFLKKVVDYQKRNHTKLLLPVERLIYKFINK